MMNVDLRHGDCVDLMRAMQENSVDSIVTDPPYGLEFMGKDWDSFKTGRAAKYAKGGELNKEKSITPKGGTNMPIGPSYVNRPAKRCGECGKQAWSGSPCKCEEPRWVLDNSPLHAFQDWFTVVAVEALRVLKPGGHLLAFGGTRTYHRMACAIEDAGFEIRDSIHWVYGSGFPKSLNIGKAIDKAAGVEREVVGLHDNPARRSTSFTQERSDAAAGLYSGSSKHADGVPITVPATEDAARWEGWGTALKPAHEPIVVARKPLQGTVAGNVLVWGTGGLNIDGCRVGSDEIKTSGARAANITGDTRSASAAGMYGPSEGVNTTHTGRWPANVVFDRTAGEALDQQSGASKSLSGGVAGWQDVYVGGTYTPISRTGYEDSGGASRFFTQADFGPDDWPFVYQAKPSRKERNAGLNGLEPKRDADRVRDDGVGGDNPRNRSNTAKVNHHPTVKPVALMRHLVRLVTPPGGTVLDPFAGSGTTLVAAVLEGFDAIGCEMTDEYLPIIEGRIAWAQEQVWVRAELEKAQAKQERLL
jgi:DNA modification methylase